MSKRRAPAALPSVYVPEWTAAELEARLEGLVRMRQAYERAGGRKSAATIKKVNAGIERLQARIADALERK